MRTLAGRRGPRTVPVMDTMRIPRLHAAGRVARRRAATMIEFALILPTFLFMMLFTFDMGSMMLLSGAMNDAAFSTARASAQVGGAGVSPLDGSFVCPANGECAGGIAYTTMSQGVKQIPFGAQIFTWNGDLNVTSGAVCRSVGRDVYVSVETTYEVDFITPGLYELMGLVGRDGTSLTAEGVARCEIYR